MPGSIRENDEDIQKWVKDNDIRTVLDVGAGMGTYSTLLRHLVITMDAIEVWQPYVDEFALEGFYDMVRVEDVRQLDEGDFVGYDLVIFGDVLEHMSREESLRVWHLASSAKYGMLSVPIVHFPQGEMWNNPYERHIQEDMFPDEVRRDYGPFVFEKEYEWTGTFIKEF
jgi:predicted TPR repeat methyltransferase